MPRVVLGVAGGIAAYKAAEVLRLLTEAGVDVTVVPTESALNFVGAPTWEALSGRPVATDVWHDVPGVAHVRLGQQADVVVVVPATADLLARAVHGRADDLLAATLLATKAPVVLVPAMHTEMWQHPATVDNVATLRARGVIVLDPANGRLTGADSGPGRLPEPQAIAAVVHRLLRDRVDGAVSRAPADLAGVRVVVSAGGTREPIDPVRFVGNSSSGRQGYALAATAAARGASVTLVSAAQGLPDPAGVSMVRVSTALEMQGALEATVAHADIVVMAAAVADYRPDQVAAHKVKKVDSGDTWELTMVRNPDILRGLVDRRRPGQVFVGFAAETGDEHGDVLTHGARKLTDKGVDLLVVNDVSGDRVFGQPTNEVVVLSAAGESTSLSVRSKEDVADSIWDLAFRQLRSSGP